MALATGDCTFWGFLWWIKHNSFKSIEAMNEDDLDAMSAAFAVENPDTLTATDVGTYTNVTYPKEATAAGSGVTAAQTTAACEQSIYPEQHLSGG